MKYVYKCNTCEYAIFNYNKSYKLKKGINVGADVPKKIKWRGY